MKQVKLFSICLKTLAKMMGWNIKVIQDMIIFICNHVVFTLQSGWKPNSRCRYDCAGSHYFCDVFLGYFACTSMVYDITQTLGMYLGWTSPWRHHFFLGSATKGLTVTASCNSLHLGRIGRRPIYIVRVILGCPAGSYPNDRDRRLVSNSRI